MTRVWRAGGAVLVAVCLLAVGTASATAPGLSLNAGDTATVTCAGPSMVIAGKYPYTNVTLECKPSSTFPASAFDQPIPAAQALNANSVAFAADLTYDIAHYFGSVGLDQMPIFTVPAGQPAVTVTTVSGCAAPPMNAPMSIPIPAGAYPSAGADSDMVVYQPSTDTVWELWKAELVNGGWSICHGGILHPSTSSGVFPSPWGLSATGISYLATTVTEADVQSGAINHTLAVDLPRCNYGTPPADRHDCGADPGQPAEGQWFEMPSTVPMPSGLTPLAQLVFAALQKYGAVVTDYAGGVELETESRADWAFTGHTGTDPLTTSLGADVSATYKALNGIPWGDLQTIVP